jgi:Tfp pilus assembly protein PilV
MTQLFVDTLANEAGTGPTELTKQSAAKAYGQGAPNGTVNKSLNVSSLTDTSTGQKGWSFTNAFSDAVYQGTLAVEGNSTTNAVFSSFQDSTITSNDFNQLCRDNGGSSVDADSFHMNIHGTLA